MHAKVFTQYERPDPNASALGQVDPPIHQFKISSAGSTRFHHARLARFARAGYKEQEREFLNGGSKCNMQDVTLMPGRFLWEILARWSFVDRQSGNDIIQDTIEIL